MSSRMAKPFFTLTVLCLLFTRDVNSLDWQTEESGVLSAPLHLPNLNGIGFRRVPASESGVRFSNQLDSERSVRNRNLLSGSGVAAGDFDGDGWCDLYFCGLDNGNKLYRNRGNWAFEDVTGTGALACDGQDSTAAAFADVDGDADLDLLVNALGNGTRLFRNDGSAGFTEVTQESGLASTAGSMSMTLADIDGDNDLDLYVANFHPTTIKDRPNTKIRVSMVNGRPVVTSVNGVSTEKPQLNGRFEISQSRDILEFGESDFLFLNNGKGFFSRVDYLEHFRDENGARLPKLPMDWGLAARFEDIDRDGRPDLYVCNDLFTPDRIWMNDGNGRFRAIPKQAIRSTSTFSMGVDFADFDRDGDTDLFVVDMLSREHEMQHLQVSEIISNNEPHTFWQSRPQVSRNTLQVNRGDNTFAELAYHANVEASGWSWGPIFLDVDLDGYEDILVTNGQLRDFQNADMAAEIEAIKQQRKLSQADILQLISRFPALRTPNAAFRNNRDGTFSDWSAKWQFDQPGISQGMALADLDNDGDMDVIMNNLLEQAGLYKNLAAGLRVRVALLGNGANRQGIGAKVAVRQHGKVQQQEIISAGRYLSSDQSIRSFGVESGSFYISVTWPSGKVTEVKSPIANRAYVIPEAESTRFEKRDTQPAKPLFRDVSSTIGHVHHDELFEDFRRQLLMPFKFSQPGPAVCWHDIDSDGWDDLIVSGGAGQRLAMFRNGRDGSLKPITSPILKPANWDQAMVLPFSASQTGAALLVGVSNYESGSPELPSGMIYNFGKREATGFVTGQAGCTGPMCQTDLDGDGDLDLFVGGRILPGRYPAAADSVLLENRGGKLHAAHRWPALGMVQGAIFSDLTGDERPELILALHWDSIRVFGWEKDSWQPRDLTAALGLAPHAGWWNGVATGDFNKDGRMDIVATNWGLNWRRKPSATNPIRVYHGDLNGDGISEVIEAVRRGGRWYPERRFGILRAAMPLVGERMSGFAQLGRSSVEQVFGERLQDAAVLEVNEFRSMLFLNLKGGVKAVPLPAEAQWSASFGLVAKDFDGDRQLDLFLGQNFFATNPEYSRCDAGRGLLMLGNGRGNFRPLPSSESGIAAYGEQRGCAVSDYNQDGRIDLAIGQNNAPTRLLLNTNGKPGLRIRLKGAGRNPNAIGATVALRINGDLAITREVQSGSGYWGANSPVIVLPALEAQGEITVTWPNGGRTTRKIAAGTRQVALSQEQ
ncbi:MAG: FG-GAP-like repeat-containing protein [Verrucomicrobiota bacterium]|nr:FG-GAP-like repeat-containing protein [Verrucomicrobiota bacterium]